MAPALVDAHTHLDFEALAADLDAVVARARDAGVGWWVICGSDPDAWDHTEAVAARTGGVAALGVHPWVAADLDDAEVDRWLDVLAARRPGILGEFGLDALWYRDDAARARQRRVVRAQLALARDWDVPVVLHCVRAYPELLALVERDGLPAAGGMVHAWSGPADEVARAVRLGLHVSFGPLVLRDKARKARQSVPRVPLERLLVETDCPCMAPVGVERGEPAHLPLVAAEVASLRGTTLDDIATATTANAARLLRREWGASSAGSTTEGTEDTEVRTSSGERVPRGRA